MQYMHYHSIHIIFSLTFLAEIFTDTISGTWLRVSRSGSGSAGCPWIRPRPLFPTPCEYDDKPKPPCWFFFGAKIYIYFADSSIKYELFDNAINVSDAKPFFLELLFNWINKGSNRDRARVREQQWKEDQSREIGKRTKM